MTFCWEDEIGRDSEVCSQGGIIPHVMQAEKLQPVELGDVLAEDTGKPVGYITVALEEFSSF